MLREISVEGGLAHQVRVTRRPDSATVWVDGRPVEAALIASGTSMHAQVDGAGEQVWVATEGDVVHVHAFGRAWQVSVVDPHERSGRTGTATDVATAPMPGVVIGVHVDAGASVVEGQPLVLIESMKMQTQIAVPRDGVVERIHLRVGDQFERGAALVTLVAAEPEED